MKKPHEGSITTALLVILTVLGLFVWAYGTTPATSEDVQVVVQKAKSSSAATAIVQSALKETPTPTVFELGRMRDKVNEQLVLDISKSATGDASLQAISAKKEEGQQNSAAQLAAIVDAPAVSWGINGVLVLLLIWAFIFALRKAKDDGP